KSTVHVAFGSVMGINGDGPARGTVARRLRGVINPARVSRPQTADRLGQSVVGSRRLNTASNFFAPQRGCRFRSAITAVTTSASVAKGLWRGRRDRSVNPVTPSASSRSPHLYPVLPPIPY